ncbi:MAG TPA: HDOD domain-containing protein [Castellaniella sp.]|uniref:EAL and HDOD domain-containing protein n=1 Tax=Castellaniella sp. TaxID=1955812 RepID=UPI002F0E5955
MEPSSTTESVAEQAETQAALPPYLLRREPILDQNRGLAGYRLRVLWADTEKTDRDPGMAVMSTARSHGVNACLAYVPHWLDGTPALLKSPFAFTLPRHRTYVELPEGTEATPEIIQALQGLAHGGLQCSIQGDLAAKAEYSALLPFCKVVSFNPARSSKADIFRQSFQHKQAKRQLLADGTPNKAALDNFLLLGFTLFEGGQPADVTSGTALSPRQKTLLRLVMLIMGGGEIPEIQASLQRDTELVKTLLDMVNTPAYGLSQEVESLSQAIMLLGRRHLQRWIQMLMYTESGRAAGFLSPTLIQACARAHLMEALSTLRHPEQAVRAEAAFTTGILSPMDQIFHSTMQSLLSDVELDVPIRQALLQREGELGQELRLATLIFPSNGDDVEDLAPLLTTLGLNPEMLDPLIQNAFVWAHGITRAAP